MAVLKKHLTPIGRGGISKVAGKGSSSAPMPNRAMLQKLQRSPSNSINDYSKATPTADGDDPTSPGGYGLGSGSWAGNGM